MPHESISILGVTVCHDLSWKPPIMATAKTASKKLGILFRFRKYFTPLQLLKLSKGLVHSCLEYSPRPCTTLMKPDHCSVVFEEYITNMPLTSRASPFSRAHHLALGTVHLTPAEGMGYYSSWMWWIAKTAHLITCGNWCQQTTSLTCTSPGTAMKSTWRGLNGLFLGR